MKSIKKIITAVFLFTAILILSNTAQAQYRRYGRGEYRHGNYYAYNYYRPYHPILSVNIGPNYGYHPYYSNSIYRAPYAYTHFGPSFGFRVNILPFGYFPFFVGNNPYYYYDGIYYRPYNGGGYEVAPPPLGATVKSLPSNCKVTVVDGQKYYELGGTFYQEVITEKNKVRYQVVGTDGVLNTQNNAEENYNNVAPQTNNMAPQNNTTVIPQNNNQTNVVPELGTMFDRLPEGSKQVIISKQKYYVSPNGTYYQEVIDGNNVRYQVTGNATFGN